MSETPLLEYESIPTIVGNMWATLAETFRTAAGDSFIAGDDPIKALRLTWYADACYWQSQGESDCPGVANILNAEQSK